ncbi:tRNA 2-selenouridine(34) synthase MnmH [Heyndrickxia vini]|uniref:tRNA 2-selenouridine(34) synthase MnmH n=1 Tax=Heyndrickxia vini TaxID=1476025 RepID=A0ABX7E7T1_9BACI|nr:tRNA 2-selenouridine(34) synthase MnmH [Heyndrickxia vini]QQZ11306.1 tRNA 2-selenouridine(34) synthase MnmH [Heyndrickxia vini]
MFHDISIEELRSLKNNNELTIIDVRSQSEYKDATIPGSINIPFFNDDERAEIGTIYKQISPQAAKERGLEIMSAKLPGFVKEFAKLNGKKAVFCWRGGMRSKTTATVLGLMGINVFRLNGGYRAFRNWVVDTLNTLELQPKAYILNGYTGSGKTTILHHLKREGYPVIDLEGMAKHRGSIFGQIGLEPNNQKTFDAQLLEEILSYNHSPYIIFEGESKRIGKITLPNFIIEKKEQGVQLFIDIPLEERVRHILEDYQPWLYEKECFEAFSKIKRRIHTPIANKIETDLKSGEYSSAVRLLLEYYYDPLYEHTAEQYPEDSKIYIKAKNVEEAIENIRDQIRVKL